MLIPDSGSEVATVCGLCRELMVVVCLPQKKRGAKKKKKKLGERKYCRVSLRVSHSTSDT